jgi:hypothetical protein
MIKEENECTHGNDRSKYEKCPIQNSDKMLSIKPSIQQMKRKPSKMINVILE